MRLALYYPWVYLKGGAERTLLNLIRASRHEWTLFTNHYDRESTFPEFEDLDVVELRRVSVRRSVLHAGHAAYTLLSQRLPVDRYEALLVVTESLGNAVTLRSTGRPLFCLCLTPLRVGYDPVIRQRFESSAHLLSRAAVHLFKLADRPLWQRYRKVFPISEEIRSRLLNAGLVDPGRLQIAHPGVHLEASPPVTEAEPFFLLPGRIMWTKQIELGIDSFARLKQTVPAAAGFRLVIAGMVDRKSRPYLTALQSRAAALGPDVEFLECPSDTELRDLYRRCFATLFTAYNEDWGLVPLEGMAASRPVIAVNRGGPRETVLHERTGLLVEPAPEAFAPAMARLIEEPLWAAQLGRAGRERAAQFSWSQFAASIDAGIEAELGRAVPSTQRAVSGPGPVVTTSVPTWAPPAPVSLHRHRPAIRFPELPSRIWVYTNYDCNLSCSYCVARSSPHAERRAMDLPAFQRLVDEAAELKVAELLLTGGEPFLLPDIYERVLYAGSRLRTVVLTNATLFHGRQGERIPELRDIDVALQVTIDGADAETHDAYRGDGSWAKAVRGVHVLKEHGLTVYIGSTETPANTGRLAELRAFVSALGIPPEHHHIRPLARRGYSDAGIELSAENLSPELTVNRDGVFWHPVGTDDDLLLTREIFPLRNAFDLLFRRYEAILAEGRVPERYRCAVV